MKASSLVLLVTALAVANDLGFRFTENVKRNPRSFQGATITGQVVDARTSHPLRGAIVRAARAPTDKPGAASNIGFRTGEDGKFILRGVEPGGWAFEYDNDLYPDVDDAAVVSMALNAVGTGRTAIDRACRWLAAMQCRNGGWGAFDKDNDATCSTTSRSSTSAR